MRIRGLSLLAFCSILPLLAPSLHAFHFPWDQGHDTFTPDEPPPDNGPCEDPSCDPCSNTRSPVYIPTGHFVWTETDVWIRGRMPLAVTRLYNSNDSRIGIFGKGWSCNLDVSLYQTTDDLQTITYIFRAPTGKRYSREGPGPLQTDLGQIDLVEPMADGTVMLIALDGGYRLFGAAGQLLEKVDRNGNSLSFQYDALHRIVRMEDPAGRYLELAYNGAGKVGSIVDFTGRTWIYGYDGEGTLVSVTNPLGGSRTFAYRTWMPLTEGPAYRQLTQVTDASGRIVTNVVYNADRVASYTEGQDRFTYSYNDGSRTVTKIDSRGSRWIYGYDDRGLVVSETDPLGFVVESEFDANGRLVRLEDELDQVWTWTFDELGRELSYANPAGDAFQREYEGMSPMPVRAISPTGRVARYAYDAGLNVAQITDSAGFLTRFEWSAQGDPTAVVDAEGARTELTFDAVGLLVSVTDPLGRESEARYDALGRAIEYEDAAGAVTQIEYDALDRVTRRVDALGGVEAYAYDAAGRTLSVTDPLGRATVFAYDSYGRLASETDADGRSTTYDYSSDNLVTAVHRPDGTTVAYQYDAAGQITGENAAGDSVSYVYDPRGDLLSATNAVGTVTRVYDSVGRMLSEQVNGETVESSYNAEGERAQLRAFGGVTDFARDVRGRLLSIESPAGRFEMEYDALGRRTALRYPSGLSASYAYDAAGQLARLEHSGGVAKAMDYEFDPNGGIVRISVGGSAEWSFEYDANGRLDRSVGPTETVDYQYDALGNWLHQGGVYDATNRLLEDADHSYAYDGRGNLTEATDKATGQTHRFQWNGRDQLVRIERFADAAGSQLEQTVEFAYGPLGRRWSRSVDGALERYVYDGLDRIGTLDASGTLLAEIVFSQEIDEPLAAVSPAGAVYYQADTVGSILGVSDASGAVVASFAYSPFGSTAVSGDPDATAFAFAGREWEADGLYYFRARYYQPSVGRFLSRDPVSADLGGSLNGYDYARNDPVNFVDNLGLGKGGKQNVRDTGLQHLTDEEIAQRARDKSLSPEERRRYQKEEKARGNRNKGKRGNKNNKNNNNNNNNTNFCPVPEPSPNLLPWIIVGIIVIGGIIILTGGAGAAAAPALASDRRLKRDLEPVDSRDFMRKVAGLGVSSWRYRWESGQVRHVGPMAQDFGRTFGGTGEETEIALVDANGVLYAAFQGMYQELKDREDELSRVQQTAREQALTIGDLKRRLDQLERIAKGAARDPAIGAGDTETLVAAGEGDA